MLEVRDLHASYDLSQILFGVGLEVHEGEAVCILGRNGVGKTTTLRSIIGLTPPHRGQVLFDGTDITGWPPYRVSRRGIGFVPQDRRIFADLSVRENLEVARRALATSAPAWTVERIYTAFPILAQMLAVGRALMGNPRLLILDEPSEGLAPLIVETLADQIAVLKEEGMTILMAEQNLALALALADHICILDKGSVRFFGRVAEFSANDSLRHEYLIV
ncbi:MAG: ABC transporter ATP-binding protein [Candidatus Rokuibacteriota bacterium]|nr:MAG: ABC transporter ATP-binding protein [Candidatus Rokubacteria bacterium]